MTRANIPKVKIVIGKEMIWTSGLIRALTKPTTKAARKSVVIFSTSMPGTRATVTCRAIALMSQPMSKSIARNLLNKLARVNLEKSLGKVLD